MVSPWEKGGQAIIGLLELKISALTLLPETN